MPRLSKSFLPSAVALAFLLIAGGAAPASAAPVLCKSNVKLCSAGDVYPIGTAFSTTAAGAGQLLLTTAFTTEECAASTLKWKTTETSKLTGGLVGQVQSLSFEGCEPGNSSCTVAQALNLPWRIELDNEPVFGDEIKLTSGGSGMPIIRRFCKVGGTEYKCNYAGESVGLAMYAFAGESVIEATPLLARHESSTQCATTIQWDGRYTPVSPEAFLTEG